MRQAVVFGAGKIGRGFLGQLLFEGGCQTAFVDTDTDLVDALSRRGAYPLRLVSDAGAQTLQIDRVSGLDARRDAARVTQAVAGADLIVTAVGVRALPAVAAALAAGLNLRAAEHAIPIDILLCENQWHAASLMRGLLEPHLTSGGRAYCEAHVGLVETVIGRMVPAPTDAQRAEDPLLIVAEPCTELPVARAMLRADPPPLPGLILADNFEAYEARKLYLHNMSHAALAYLGFERGHGYLWQCAADPEVSGVGRAALAEVIPALAAEYNLPEDGLHAFADDLLGRFANRLLGDTVARVAADPRRKLRPEDRLVGAANLCLKHDIMPTALAKIIWSAFVFASRADMNSQALTRPRWALGEEAALTAITGLTSGSALSEMVLNHGWKHSWTGPASP